MCAFFSMKTNWKEALVYSTHLLNESRWSKSLYSYQKAAIMCMMKDDLTESDKDILNNLLRYNLNGIQIETEKYCWIF